MRVLVPYRHEKKLQPYGDALRAAGMEPVGAYVGAPVSVEGVAGLLLMGGTDVNPKLYGEEARPETEAPDQQRDAAELRLIWAALDRDLPILGICRGLQILNVYHRGTLIQHLSPVEVHDVETDDKGAPAHEVSIEAETELARIAKTDRWRVNSRHHQAASNIGANLRVSARADDGTVEGLERNDRRFVVAVQWHPEDQVGNDTEQLKLFEAFAGAL